MSMYFVQHGLNVAKDVDPARPLSEAGRREVERISAYLEKLGVAVSKVCHSGKTRAEETAHLFARKIGGGVYRVSGMSPNDDVKAFAKSLEDGAMYVGHLPHMGKLVSYLTAGREDAGVVKYENAGVVCVEKDEAGFHIEWYLRPTICGI